MSNLFKPLEVGAITVQDRIAMCPLTRLRSDGEVPPAEAVEYYGSRAAAHEGTLLISEATAIAPEAVGYYYAPGIWSEQQIEAWKKVTAKVHEGKSFIFCQLWAHGRIAVKEQLKRVGDYEVVGASDVPLPHGAKPRPLTKEGIDHYVNLYAQAAENAIAAGFDGVEIHAANGYFPNQFIDKGSNTRKDEYGADTIENRARFTLQIVDAVSAAVGANRVAIRFSPWGHIHGMNEKISPIPVYSYILYELQARANNGKALAYIHVMEPRIDFRTDKQNRVDRNANYFVRQIWKGVIIRAGGFGKDYQELEEFTADDDKLILGIGRFFISNPDLVAKVKSNTPLDHYHRPTFYWNGADWPIDQGYTRDIVGTI